MMMMIYNLQLLNAETFVYPRKFECKKTFRVNALLVKNLSELATLYTFFKFIAIIFNSKHDQNFTNNSIASKLASHTLAVAVSSYEQYKRLTNP